MSQGGADPQDGGEPSMEDILASIRRILNDDAAPVPPAEAAPTESVPLGADVFELEPSMIVEEPAEPQIISPAPIGDPPPLDSGRPSETLEEGPLLGASAAAAASASMGALVRVLGQRQTPIYHGGPTLEDIVRDELRPILKTWLDENLAPLVERTVRAEIERLTRSSL